MTMSNAGLMLSESFIFLANRNNPACRIQSSRMQTAIRTGTYVNGLAWLSMANTAI